jgi:23S rRNA pseudouridine1911/1915/1917 synthase
MQIPIIYQDDFILVVHKPAGLVVNRADSVDGQTIQDWVEESFDYELAHDDENRHGIVHRLDKDTSGVMIMAKTKEVQEELQRQFRDRETQKTYLALLHGKLEPKEGFMTLPMARNKFDRQSFGVDVDGKISRTSYKMREYLSFKEGLVEGDWEQVYAQGFTLVEAYPKTGRTHQIRVFFKHLGHPLVGDSKYLSDKKWKLDQQWCKRQFLHALKLELTYPESGERVTYEAELADDLREVLGILR